MRTSTVLSFLILALLIASCHGQKQAAPTTPAETPAPVEPAEPQLPPSDAPAAKWQQVDPAAVGYEDANFAMIRETGDAQLIAILGQTEKIGDPLLFIAAFVAAAAESGAEVVLPPSVNEQGVSALIKLADGTRLFLHLKVSAANPTVAIFILCQWDKALGDTLVNEVLQVIDVIDITENPQP